MGKDKMTHKVGFRDHLWYKWNWSPGRGRDLPKVTYWESQWKSLRTLLIVAFHPTSKLETLPNLELGPLFFWTCDSIPKILPLFPFFLTIKARLLGMNYRVCSGLVIYIFCQAPSSPPGLCTRCALCLGMIFSPFFVIWLLLEHTAQVPLPHGNFLYLPG